MQIRSSRYWCYSEHGMWSTGLEPGVHPHCCMAYRPSCWSWWLRWCLPPKSA